MPTISPHSVVDPAAELAADVVVGPFCDVGPNVKLGAGCKLISHVVIAGHTTAGADNVFYPNSVIGGPPQDRSFKGSATRLEIGDNNLFREAVTVHIGTEKGGGVTRIGNNNFLMVGAHFGHDVQVGDNCLFANNCLLGGHVIVGNNVNMMGTVAVHQFVTVGELCYIGGGAKIHYDAPPYCKIDGSDSIRLVNSKGLRMNGFCEADVEALETAHRQLFHRNKPMAIAMAQFDLNNGINPHVRKLIEFLDRRAHARHGRHQESLLRTPR
jgi:UDP-N-acetylglucosamine acyltransferase